MVTANLKKQTEAVVQGGGETRGEFAARERQFLRRYPDDKACLDHLLQLRFGLRVKCPKCARTAKFHKIRQIPAYACQWCGYHLHPMAQTRFARSRIGLRVWFHAVFLYANSSNGISARELQRLLGLTYKTAWRMRSTIIDAKFDLREQSKRLRGIEFDTLLRALIEPKANPASGKSKVRSRRSKKSTGSGKKAR